ncbi:retrovirus-related Pol polyprotein from transposon 17.6 [Trichonephila clavipes]|nr:retrovirus-related Pol polyprotein from transposon 17.6 [Trichonephila clavipes]
MDDLIIPSQNEAEGLNKLRLVLQTAADFGLELNLKKCNFLQRKIEFLGYIIENGTIKPSPSKTHAVQNFPQPQTPRQLQSFIGLTRRVISGKIASFQELKNILSENPVLHVFQQGYPLELHTDASSLGFGAVLLQKSDDGLFHPLSIHYFSRKTTVQQEKYSSYELEVLAIIEALKKFRSYLLGTKFKIITDCDAFQKTMHKKDLPAKIARWALMLEEFDYEVCHRPGRQMKHDDALSPYPIMMISSHDITQKIKEAQNKDEFISQLKSAIKITPSDEYSLKNEILYKLQRIMNSTTTRSTKFTPFEVLIGVKMKQKEDLQIKHLLEDELSEQFINKRETLRNEAKENILRLQDENKKQYNKHRKPAYNYKPGDTVAIQRTQFGTGLKLRPKYFGPYEVTKVNKHDRYEVQKIGQHEGPNVTSTSADKMKKWCTH